MDTSCSACQQKKPIVSSVPKTGIWAVVFLAILPKCPFCIMAYTSTAILCSNGVVSQGSSLTFHSPLTIGISVLTSVLVVLGILFNWRDKRTYAALALVLAGIAMVLYSVMKEGGINLYYAGVVFVFVGVWVNGSFAWLMGLLSGKMNQKTAIVAEKN